MSAVDGPVVDLSRVGQLPIVEQVIPGNASITVEPGGLNRPGCDLHLSVVHMGKLDNWLLPMPNAFARRIAQQLVDMADRQSTPINPRDVKR